MGGARRQWRPGRLHRTREEVSEARVEVLGRDLGSTETGACSAARRNTGWGRGDADPIRFRLSCGLRLAGWLERGSARRSLVRFQDGAALNCWGGGAAKTASSGKAGDGRVTRVNHFCNGCLGLLSQHLASESPIPRKVSMERGPTFVGVNVAKAQVDVAVRPGGDI